MNNAHTQTKAVAVADRCRHAFVRRVAVCCLFACASLSVAHADPGDKERDAQRIAEVQRQQQRQFEMRAEDNRRRLESQQAQQEQNAQNADAARRSSRMTADERRDLRRQINEAGSDLYKNAPRR